MAGNESNPVVAGQPLPAAASDDAQAIVALPGTEEPAAADAIGQGQRNREPASGAPVVPQAADEQGQESVWEPAPASEKPVQPEPEPAPEVESPESIAAERARLRDENRKLQAEKDRVYAQAQAEALRREQLRAEYEERQAAVDAERQKYETYMAQIEQERADARRRAEEAEYQRMLAASPPEVRKAMEVATQFIQQRDQQRTQADTQRALNKMNQYMMQGVPGEVFSGLPKDRPVTPEMVDFAAARYQDWQYMQETLTRPDFKQWWDDARARRRGQQPKVGQPAAAAPVQAAPPPQPPAAPAPAKPQPIARVTPGTGGKPPSNLEVQYRTARDSRDFREMERIRNLIAAQSGVERGSE